MCFAEGRARARGYLCHCACCPPGGRTSKTEIRNWKLENREVRHGCRVSGKQKLKDRKWKIGNRKWNDSGAKIRGCPGADFSPPNMQSKAGMSFRINILENQHVLFPFSGYRGK